ncbi:33K hydroxyproline-rich glycoprotein [Venturia nashicola]|nr:33K hydroxyproline-rich glycoprotein [Venturia nashicola]
MADSGGPGSRSTRFHGRVSLDLRDTYETKRLALMKTALMRTALVRTALMRTALVRTALMKTALVKTALMKTDGKKGTSCELLAATYETVQTGASLGSIFGRQRNPTINQERVELPSLCIGRRDMLGVTTGNEWFSALKTVWIGWLDLGHPFEGPSGI